MPRRKTEFEAGECYHIYNRGHNRQMIFFERDNYLFFLRRIRHYVLGEPDERKPVFSKNRVSEPVAEVLCYCLMPNHYHLLVRLITDDLSPAIQRLSVSYSKAVNNRRKFVGALFQGPFQARHVDREEYLLHLSRYIHLNPFDARLVRTPTDWEFSSYRDYLERRNGTLVRTELILREFASRADYQRFVERGAVTAPAGLSGLLIDDE